MNIKEKIAKFIEKEKRGLKKDLRALKKDLEELKKDNGLCACGKKATIRGFCEDCFPFQTWLYLHRK